MPGYVLLFSANFLTLSVVFRSPSPSSRAIGQRVQKVSQSEHSCQAACPLLGGSWRLTQLFHCAAEPHNNQGPSSCVRLRSPEMEIKTCFLIVFFWWKLNKDPFFFFFYPSTSVFSHFPVRAWMCQNIYVWNLDHYNPFPPHLLILERKPKIVLHKLKETDKSLCPCFPSWCIFPLFSISLDQLPVFLELLYHTCDFPL